MYKTQAEKMASFWVDAIEAGNRGSAGEESIDMLLMLTRPSKKVSTEELVELQAILEAKFEKAIAEGGGQFEVNVDYEPDGILHDACVDADIPSSLLPIKSFCCCRKDGSVYGKIGYGKEVQKL